VTDQNKRLLQFAVAFGLIGLIAAGYLWYVWGSNIVENETKRQDELSGELRRLNTELAEINQSAELQKEITEKQEFLDKASRRLPSSPNAEGFLAALSDMLDKSNANVLLINPMEVQPRSTYVEIPWAVDTIAQYVEFGIFLNLVEQNPQRLMRVKEFAVDNDPELPGYHNVAVQIGTFMFNK